MPFQVRGRVRWRLMIGIIVLHAATILGVIFVAPISQVSWPVWLASFLMYTVSSLGITAGYHRYFTHGTFVCSDAGKDLLAIMGALAGEGPLSQWCLDHRQHHAYTDGEADPHSPLRFFQPFGFLWAHLGWLFWETKRPEGYVPQHRACDEEVIAWQHRYYWLFVLVGFVLPWLFLGWPGLIWVGFVRLLLHLHVTWCVNSVCHLWGSGPVDAAPVAVVGQSRNNRAIAVLGMGEGWHANHHARQAAADLGRGKWDPGFWFILLLRRMKLVGQIRTSAGLR